METKQQERSNLSTNKRRGQNLQVVQREGYLRLLLDGTKQYVTTFENSDNPKRVGRS